MRKQRKKQERHSEWLHRHTHTCGEIQTCTSIYRECRWVNSSGVCNNKAVSDRWRCAEGERDDTTVLVLFFFLESIDQKNGYSSFKS